MENNGKVIYITEEQAKTIKDKLSKEKPSMGCPIVLLENDEVKFSKNISSYVFNGIKRLITKGFDKAKSVFNDDISAVEVAKVKNKLSKLIHICQEHESKVKNELEKFCADTVTACFDTKDCNYKLDCQLVSTIGREQLFHIKSDYGEDNEYQYEDLNEADSMEIEKDKRQFVNMISIGAAMTLADKILKERVSDIFQLDEELPHLYSKILKINEYLSYIDKERPTDENHLQGAYENIKLFVNKEKNADIEVRGVIMPFLLVETIRAYIELISMESLPKNNKEDEYIVNTCDILEDEPMYMRIGKPLWSKITKDNLEISQYNALLKKIFGLTTDDFMYIIPEVVADTINGNDNLEKLVQSAQKENEYNDFLANLKQKQENNKVMIDEFLTEEELNENEIEEANYPQAFNIEFFKTLKNFNARVQYCETYLKHISSGTGRIVYEIDENTVLKLAKNRKGVAQNQVEARPDYYRDMMSIFAETYDYDKDFLWLEMQKARRAKVTDFKRLLGIDFQTLVNWIYYVGVYVNGRMRKTMFSVDFYRKYMPLFRSEQWTNMIENNPNGYIFEDLEDYLANYNPSVGDLVRINSWGVVKDEDGSERLALVDYGLDDDVYNKYYSRE